MKSDNMAEHEEAQWHVGPADKPECDLCKTEVDIQLSKCLDCGLYICHICSTAHKNLPATKSHRVIRGVEKEPGTKSKQLRMCVKHPNEEVTFYCSTCKELICCECVIGDHKPHDFVKIKTFAKQKRQELKTELDKVKTVKIKQTTSDIDLIDQKDKENDKSRDENMKDINIRKFHLIPHLILQIEIVNKQLTAQSEIIHRSNKDMLTNAKTQLSQDLKELGKLHKEYSNVLHTGSDVEVIMAETEMSQKLERLAATDIDSELQLQLPQFIDCKLNINKLIQTMYGRIKSYDISSPGQSDMDVKIISKYRFRSESISSICPLPDNTAMIRYSCSHDIDIVTVVGQLKKTIKLDFDVGDFILTSQGDILAAEFNKPIIHTMTQDGVITGSISTGKLIPTGLCETRDGNLLVIMYVDTYDLNKSSRSLVVRMTRSGHVMEEFEYNKGTRMFTNIWGVAENISGDICVVDRGSTGQMILLDNRGNIKCIYNGQEWDGETFRPLNVKCDRSGHIIVYDFISCKAHMLGIDGEFIRYIITEADLVDYPSSVAIDSKGVLWVGCDKGNIYRIKYET